MYKATNEYVFDRIYDSIKSLVVSGQLAEGERLNIEKLALQFDVSTSPVREVLNRLVAEDLIDMTPKIGFSTKHITETDVRDLIELNRLLLDWAVEYAQQPQALPVSIEPLLFPGKTDNTPSANKQSSVLLATLTGKLFAHIALHSDNHKLLQTVGQINDRLYYLRQREFELTPNSAKELFHLYEVFSQQKYRSLKNALKIYHDNRFSSLPLLLKRLALYPPAEQK